MAGIDISKLTSAEILTALQNGEITPEEVQGFSKSEQVALTQGLAGENETVIGDQLNLTKNKAISGPNKVIIKTSEGVKIYINDFNNINCLSADEIDLIYLLPLFKEDRDMIKNLFNGYFANIDNLNKFDIENCNVDTNLLSEAEKHLLKFIPEIAKQDISEIYKNKFGLSMDELYSMLYE